MIERVSLWKLNIDVIDIRPREAEADAVCARATSKPGGMIELEILRSQKQTLPGPCRVIRNLDAVVESNILGQVARVTGPDVAYFYIAQPML